MLMRSLLPLFSGHSYTLRNVDRDQSTHHMYDYVSYAVTCMLTTVEQTGRLIDTNGGFTERTPEA